MKLIANRYLWCLVFLFSICFTKVEATKMELQLKKCGDGDTATFYLDEQVIKVRFLAIDTPESVHPKKKVQPFGIEASDFTCYFLTKAQKIEIEFDSHSQRTDRYHRYLGWIWVDGDLLQRLLVRNGYARVAYIYGKYNYLTDLCQDQASAQLQKRNIWSQPQSEGYCDQIDYQSGKPLDEEIYQVSFDLETKHRFYIKEGERVTPVEAPSKDGYIFKGWYAESQRFDFEQPIFQDVELKPKYEPIFYSKFDFFYLVLTLIAIILAIVSKKSFKKGNKHGSNYKKSIKSN